MYKIDQEQLQESLKRRGLYAEKVLQDKASYLNGKSKILNYLLQDPPSGNSLPILLIPYSEKLVSLFSFTIRCKLPINEEFQCQFCFQRNECLRKIFNQLQTQISKMNHKVLTIDDILQDYMIWRHTSRMEVIIQCLVDIMIEIGEVND